MNTVFRASAVIFVLVQLIAYPQYAQRSLPAFMDSDLSVNERVTDLLDRMTVLEKARQLDMYSGADIVTNNSLDADKVGRVIGVHGMGSIHDLYPEDSRLSNQIQKYIAKNPTFLTIYIDRLWRDHLQY